MSAQNDQPEKMNKANQFPAEMPGVGHNKILKDTQRQISHLFSGYSKTNLKVKTTTEQRENGQKASSAQKVRQTNSRNLRWYLIFRSIVINLIGLACNRRVSSWMKISHELLKHEIINNDSHYIYLGWGHWKAAGEWWWRSKEFLEGPGLVQGPLD